MKNKSYLNVAGISLSTLQLILIVVPSFVLFGYNQAGLGGLLTEPDWVKTFPELDTVHSTGAEKSIKSTIQGTVVAVFVLGALVGALSCTYTGNAFGRRLVIFIGGVCSLIGSTLEASSFGLPQFVVGRMILGFGVGQLSSIVPIWQAETSDASHRGRHVIIDGISICLGYLLESWIDLGFFEFQTGQITWRPPIAISIVFSLTLISSIYWFPESPRWLVMQNRREEAIQAISALRGASQDMFEVEAEVAAIEYSLEETAQKVRFKDIFKMGEDKLLYRFGLCIVLQFFQSMSGSTLVSVYATIIFQQNLGMSPELSRVLSSGALSWKFLSSFIAFFTIDRFGRRIGFIISGTGMACCMAALAVSTSFPSDNKAAQISAAAFIYLFNTWVPIGFLGANFLYCTEVAPIRLRTTMASISTANHWLWNFVISMVTPIAIDSIGWRYYILFAVVSACVPITVYFFYPETMGRNLEEIDLMFKESPSPWATVNFAKSRPVGLPQEFSEKAGGTAEHIG